MDMGDGGIGFLLSVEEFVLLTAVIVRGDYLLTYLIQGAKENTTLVVHDGVSGKVFEQFRNCTRNMLG
jgi:hypothetical protein